MAILRQVHILSILLKRNLCMPCYDDTLEVSFGHLTPTVPFLPLQKMILSNSWRKTHFNEKGICGGFESEVPGTRQMPNSYLDVSLAFGTYYLFPSGMLDGHDG
jgi:hypothetical protein